MSTEFEMSRRTGIHKAGEPTTFADMLDVILTGGPVEQLDRALGNLRIFGWGRTGEKLQNESGEMCIVGCLLWDQRAWTDTLELVAAAAGVEVSKLDEWNDAPERTRKDVENVLTIARTQAALRRTTEAKVN